MGYYTYSSEETKALREKVIEFFGGKCMNPNCLVIGGCSDKRCLQIDHIQAVGKNRLLGAELYLDILESSTARERYQLLCANCNWIKRHEKHEIRGNITNLVSQYQVDSSRQKNFHVSIEPVIESRFTSLGDIEKVLRNSKDKNNLQ